MWGAVPKKSIWEVYNIRQNILKVRIFDIDFIVVIINLIDY